MSLCLTDHHFHRPGHDLPPVDESLLFDYVVASNATFARGRRPGIEVCMPVGFSFINARRASSEGSSITSMSGLAPLFAYLQWGYPKVPEYIFTSMLTGAQARSAYEPKEMLFHLSWSGSGRWQLEIPQQTATDQSVVPIETGAGTSTERAIIEVHSHHDMPADFSAQDDIDESQGFRIYAVIGRIFDKPEIRTRVGLFGHFLEWPSGEVFELPERLKDCVQFQ